MKHLAVGLAILIATYMASGIAFAQTSEPKAPTPAAPTQPGNDQHPSTGYRGMSGQVAIGETAPGFDLTNADGKRVRMSGFVGMRVLLCFADRREMVAELGAVAESLAVSGVRLVVIARDSPRSLKSLAERENLTFEMLSDPTGEISGIYGSYDSAISSIRPGYVLVGPKGLVRMVLLGQRLPPGELLQITRYALTTI